ncbi:hypothetical protein UFOVP67_67 [uncultured Caudovirales phage]|uniref:Uncharacterized protein n=1 Tax=uncultured Caudovirales phage TaxID=2100421 RepID=A0A6J5T975_9CAUD|nr:hypothetical protein UFOVP67_67 [uncultured Caudovirales phage]
MKIHKLDHYPVHYALCSSEKEFNAFCKKNKLTGVPYIDPIHNSGLTVPLYYKEGAMVLVMISEIETDTLSILGILAHESVHVKQFIMAEIGEEKLGLEAEAYLVDSIFTTLLKDLLKVRYGVNIKNVDITKEIKRGCELPHTEVTGVVKAVVPELKSEPKGRVSKKRYQPIRRSGSNLFID